MLQGFLHKLLWAYSIGSAEIGVKTTRVSTSSICPSASWWPEQK